MKRIGDKRLARHPVFGHMTAVLLTGAIVVLFWAVWGVHGKYQEAKGRKTELARELMSISMREEMLEKKLNHLETTRGMEEEIRGKFQVARAGEGVLVLVEPKSNGSSTTTPERNIWQRILDFFWF